MTCSPTKYLLLVFPLWHEFASFLHHIMSYIFSQYFALLCYIDHTMHVFVLFLSSLSSPSLLILFSSPPPLFFRCFFSSLFPLPSLFFSTGTSCVLRCSITCYGIIAGIKCEFSDAKDTSSDGTGVQLVITTNGERMTINITRKIAAIGYSFSLIQ